MKLVEDMFKQGEHYAIEMLPNIYEVGNVKKVESVFLEHKRAIPYLEMINTMRVDIKDKYFQTIITDFVSRSNTRKIDTYDMITIFYLIEFKSLSKESKKEPRELFLNGNISIQNLEKRIKKWSKKVKKT